MLSGMPLAAVAQAPATAAPPNLETPVVDPNGFTISRLRFFSGHVAENTWDEGPEGDDNVLAYLKRVTNIKVSRLNFKERAVGIDEYDKIHLHPFLLMTDSEDFVLNPKEAEALGEFFRRGGFLYADDCVDSATKGDHFYQAYRREIKKALPGCEMQPVPPDHEIYHCFFDFPGKAPYCSGQHDPDLGLFYQGRMVSFLTSVDVHCGWWYPPFADARREQSLKMGVNIIIYALTH